jgi:hypothetical protein
MSIATAEEEPQETLLERITRLLAKKKHVVAVKRLRELCDLSTNHQCFATTPRSNRACYVLKVWLLCVCVAVGQLFI